VKLLVKLRVRVGSKGQIIIPKISRRSSTMKIFIDSNILIYLNDKMPEHEARLVESFWLDLLINHTLYTNILVLDEVVYISRN